MQLTLSFLADEVIRKMPDSELAERLVEMQPNVESYVFQVGRQINHALRYTAQAGQLLDELFHRHGSDWANALPKLVPGLPLATAAMWRAQWRNRDRVFPPDDAPAGNDLAKAYRNAELLPPCEPSAKGEEDAKPFFRLTFSRDSRPVSEWPRADLIAFLTKAEPIGTLIAEAKEAFSQL
jgi:hypothetical protein